MITLPTAAGATTEYEDFYETTLAAPVGASDTDIYPTTMPNSAVGFLVIDPLGSTPEIIFYNVKGSNYVRVPSNTDGQGRGVGTTTPRAFDQGVKIGMYSIAEFYEGLASGALMRDGFLQTRHFSSSIDPNSWIGTGETWNYVGNNGQREYQYVVAGDKRTKYNKGMKVRMPRVVAVGTQSVNFQSASSHFARKTTPSGMTWTDDFSFAGWLTLTSFPATDAALLSRFDTATGNGFIIFVTPTGNLVFSTYNAGAGNSKRIQTNQAIPLGRKIHLAGTLDMSSFTTATNKLFFDAIEVVSALSSSGTNPTSFTQAGNLEMAAFNGGGFINAQMSEWSLWSAVLTQAQVRDRMHKQLVGNEANLVSYWKLDGNFNDSNANANHLTAQNGATATNVSNAFNAVEYGIITNLSFSAGNTTITVWTGAYCNAPYENLTGIGYSAAQNPIGFPERPNWTVSCHFRNQFTQNNPTGGQWYNIGSQQLSLPMGDWDLRYQTSPVTGLSGSNIQYQTLALSPTAATEDEFITQSYQNSASTQGFPRYRERPVSNNTGAQQVWYLNQKQQGGGAGTLYNMDNSAGIPVSLVEAVSAYV